MSETASEMVCFSASVNARLGAAADSAVGSMGSNKFDIQPVSKLEARIIAKDSLTHLVLGPYDAGMDEQASEDCSGPIVARQLMASQYALEVWLPP